MTSRGPCRSPRRAPRGIDIQAFLGLNALLAELRELMELLTRRLPYPQPVTGRGSGSATDELTPENSVVEDRERRTDWDLFTWYTLWEEGNIQNDESFSCPKPTGLSPFK